MHQNRNYLNMLRSLMKKENIAAPDIVSYRGLGSIFHGSSYDFMCHEGSISKKYDMALVAAGCDKKELEKVYGLIADHPSLKMPNLENKGFICTLPIDSIKSPDTIKLCKNEEEPKMKIGEYLTKDKIRLKMSASTMDEAIIEIAGSLRKDPVITNFDKFVFDVFTREKLQTTGIGDEVAIPHARTDATEDFAIAFGRHAGGIDFKSADGKPAKLIFLMATPKNKKLSSYLKILAHLSRLLKKDDFRQSLLTASTPENVLEAFKKLED